MPVEVTPEDRKYLDALLAAIDDPRTTDEPRSELRDEYSSVANAYVMLDLLGDPDNPNESCWEILDRMGIPSVPAEEAGKILEMKVHPSPDGLSYVRDTAILEPTNPDDDFGERPTDGAKRGQ